MILAGMARRMVFAMLIRAGLKMAASRSIDSAAGKLEAQLPDSVVRAVNTLPGDMIRVGGSALVAADAAKVAALTTKSASIKVKRAGVAAGSGAAKVRSVPRRAAAWRESVADEIQRESEKARRSLTSDFQRELRGDDAALDAQLDRRDADRGPLPEVPSPVRTGRRRFVPQLGPAPVNRVQRSYQKPTKAWDRPLRRR